MKPAKNNSMVESPSHYQGISLEAIDVIDDFELNFNLGNSVKYILRCGKKDASKSVEDLEKAIKYLKREINKLNTLAKSQIPTNSESSPLTLFYDDGVIYDEKGSQVEWIDIIK